MGTAFSEVCFPKGPFSCHVLIGVLRQNSEGGDGEDAGTVFLDFIVL